MKDFKMPIVNENDEIIGYKGRKEIGKNDIYRVTGLWIENSKGDILIAQRSFSKKNDPGKWGPAAAGSVEEGETYDSNVYKEAEEEIGLVGIQFKQGDKIRRSGEYNYFVQWYSAVVDLNLEQFKIKSDEIEQIRWISKSDLKKEVEENPEMFLASLRKFV